MELRKQLELIEDDNTLEEEEFEIFHKATSYMLIAMDLGLPNFSKSKSAKLVISVKAS